ncbi:MAG: hypothetical protein M3619_00765 [Myxococcota bacterium]|nr:hypothetical protein [Myxococcota bacterium]
MIALAVLGALGSILVLCAAMALHPRAASCPRGSWVNGVRPSGRFECRVDIGPDCDMRGARTCPEVPDVGGVAGRIYCERSEMPLVVNHRTVACRRRP